MPPNFTVNSWFFLPFFHSTILHFPYFCASPCCTYLLAEKCRTLNKQQYGKQTPNTMIMTPTPVAIWWTNVGECHVIHKYICPAVHRKPPHNSAPRLNFKNLLNNFFCINMRCHYAKLQFSSFKSEGGVWGDERMMYLSYIHADGWQKSTLVKFLSFSTAHFAR